MISTTTVNIIKIKEGNVYPFQIKGLLQLPDGAEYFVLNDPNSVKHLLEKKHYLNYHFEIGQLISCRIDKINCNGKIYLEPLHPYYRIGKSYYFPLVRIEQIKSENDRRKAIFEDVFCNEIILSLINIPAQWQVGELVRLNVLKIKKGLVILSEPGFNEDYRGLSEGVEQPFYIKDFIDAPGKRSFYIITAPDGSMYKLRHKFYERYGMTVGQTVYCRLIKSRNELFLEPRHPYYKINEHYDFEIIGMDTVPNYPTGEKKVCILRNDYGKDIIIPIDKLNADLSPIGKLNCRIRDIRKGRLLLNCLKSKNLPK